MSERSDIELLQDYIRRQSDEAFALLVGRHVNLVYSAALRKTGNAGAAEEITQAVFIILATKAARLRRGPVLSSWLYQTTRFTAASFLRTESRRTRREHEAYMQSRINEPEPEVWRQISPLLEDAMGKLSQKDRNAIALRFFEGRNFEQVGTALGATENAAKKRVAHALEKLRKFFAKRGVASTTAIIAGMISAHSVHAAPVGLATATTTVAIAKGAAASGSTLALIKGALKAMAWSKAKTAAVVGGAAVLLVIGGAEKLRNSHLHRDVTSAAEALQRLAKPSPQDYFPRSSWVFAGYATPVSAVMSCLWAVRQQDADKILDSVVPAMQQQARHDFENGKSPKPPSLSQAVVQSVCPMFTNTPGFFVLDQTPISTGAVFLGSRLDWHSAKDEVAVHLLVPGDLHVEYAFLLRRVGDEWKIVDFKK